MLASLLAPLLALQPVPFAQQWDGRYFLGGLSGSAGALATFDDGSGPALFVGGRFSTVDDLSASQVVRWDGKRWSTLASGLSGSNPNDVDVKTMLVFDDGSGPELYVGGRFTRAGAVNVNGLARWNGTRWAAVGTGTGSNGLEIRALAAFDDGRGPALYAGGIFTSIGGTSASSIARWDGTSWTPVGLGIGSVHSTGPGEVEALAVLGGELYAGGEFSKADGLPARNLARWDGVKWNALGEGATRLFSSSASVYALELVGSERGEGLLIGGDFNQLDGRPAESVGLWDGDSFHPLGTGLPAGSVHSLAFFDDGGGTELYAGGLFFLPGGPRITIARFDGQAWSLVGDDLTVEAGTSPVVDLEVFGDGTRKTLFAAGAFEFSGERVVRALAELRDGAWRSPSGRGQGIDVSINSSGTVPVSALTRWDDGRGEALYAAGNFIAAGESAASRIARWDGQGWEPLGLGAGGFFASSVFALGVFDDGTGSALFAGGNFTSIGTRPIASVARWDGVEWWPLGTGLGNASSLGFTPNVRAFQVFDDGTGPALYVGGAFNAAGGAFLNSLARWDGAHWSDVGGGVTASSVGVVTCMAVFDDGRGPALYVGGGFQAAGGVTAYSIARWDGTSWSDVGGGFDPFSSTLLALEVFDDGTGPALYAGGIFFTAGGTSANNLARWNGSSWSVVGGGLTSSVQALEVHDDGAGPALFVGGEFTRTIAGQTLLRIGRWDGSSWTALASGVDGGSLPGVHALCGAQPDGVPALFVGGKFTHATVVRSSNLACWTDARWRRRR